MIEIYCDDDFGLTELHYVRASAPKIKLVLGLFPKDIYREFLKKAAMIEGSRTCPRK